MEQRVIIGKSIQDVNELLNMGWKVVSVTAQHVAIAGAANGNASYNITPVMGNFCFVLEKSK